MALLEAQALAQKLLSEEKENIEILRLRFSSDSDRRNIFENFISALEALAQTAKINPEALKSGSPLLSETARIWKGEAVSMRLHKNTHTAPEEIEEVKAEFEAALGYPAFAGLINPSVFADAFNQTSNAAVSVQIALQKLLRAAGLRASGKDDRGVAD